MRRLLVLMMFLACAAGSAAQVASGGEFTLQRSVVGGGGGTLSGGDYQLRSTAGQAEASSQSSGGTMTVTGGFWAGKTHIDVLFRDSFEGGSS